MKRDNLATNARKLRKNSTEAERKLWRHIRSKQIAGAKFRRQQPIGDYIVDFVCFEAKVVVELDGGQHTQADNRAKDSQRDKYFQDNGYTVLRFWNNDVLKNMEGVKEILLREIEAGVKAKN